ncbi:hypothetical protein ACOZ4F_01945 [Haloarcula marismortui]|uniref:hypothetical protein n=1 Tax=Haloarcula marismortui TaxID=2238 RepID=UPI003C73FA0C
MLPEHAEGVPTVLAGADELFSRRGRAREVGVPPAVFLEVGEFVPVAVDLGRIGVGDRDGRRERAVFSVGLVDDLPPSGMPSPSVSASYGSVENVLAAAVGSVQFWFSTESRMPSPSLSKVLRETTSARMLTPSAERLMFAGP